MITFDKIKLVSDISNIQITDEGSFMLKSVKGAAAQRIFHQEKPFCLDIKIDYIKKELVIEFTGKILGKDYPSLISMETIRRCFDAINGMGFCLIDVERMMEADVVKCDVTKDIDVDDVQRLTSFIRGHVSNYQNYICRKMKNGNMTIEKNVTQKQAKKRLSVYDKGKEMGKASNRQFAEENGLEGAFDGKCRFELNLNSKEQIRSSLGLGDTKLKSVLMSEANPILGFVNEVVKVSPSQMEVTDRKNYMKSLLLKECGYDLEKVEAKMRWLHPSRGTNMRKLMEPYRALMEQMGGSEAKDYWNEIRDKLCQ